MNRCKHCKKETKNKSYCSVECRNNGYEGKKKVEYVTINCHSCKKNLKLKKYWLIAERNIAQLNVNMKDIEFKKMKELN